MAGISGDPGTTAEDGVSGKTNEIGVPEPIRKNPSESIRDGKKQITVRAIRMKDGAGSGTRPAGFDADGDVVVFGSGGNGNQLPFDYDNWDDTRDAQGDITKKQYLLSGITQGEKNYAYNVYGHIDNVILLASGVTLNTWVYSYATNNYDVVGAEK